VSRTEVTVGVDIGTSSVKAIAADGDGSVVATARVPHEVRIPAPGRFEHDAEAAWRRGPREALAAVATDLDVKGVSVAGMVPSLTAVGDDGVPVVPGLLYGDERGREAGGGESREGMTERGELLGFMSWALREAPDAAGFWPAQAVANHALCGEAVMDMTTAATAHPFFDFNKGWIPEKGEELGVRVDQMPRVMPAGWKVGQVDGDGPALASGSIDAMAEQIVAGADDDGDVLVILGTTLIIWAVTTSAEQVPGYWTIPHTAEGKLLVGGPSNAGGLFCNWANTWFGDAGGEAHPDRVPVWAPYPRGERAPIHDPMRRAVLADLDLTHDAAAIRRATFEASGFVVRRMLDTARDAIGLEPKRIVATGGGTRVDEWVQAVADATKVPIDCVAVPEGGALGSAWLARIAAGLEEVNAVADGRKWARTGRRVEPDTAWAQTMEPRYRRFLDLS
jgi:xylulokinase